MKNHDPDKKIHEFEERLTKLEKTSAIGPRKSVRVTIGVINWIFVFLALVGVIQFVSAG